MPSNYDIFDIFTDASIDKHTRLACAGFICVNRDTGVPVARYLYLDPNSTNNRAEIMGVNRAVAFAVNSFYNTVGRPFEVNIISDSMLSIEGIRNWMLTWDAVQDGVLLNSSGQEAANQSFFKDIFSMITSSGLKVRFYHQKGHVAENSPASLFKSEKVFYHSNQVSVANAGFTAKYLAKYNNWIDKATRELIQQIQSGYAIDPNDAFRSYYKEIPMEFVRNDLLIDNYRVLLQGGINYPLHQY